MISFKVVFEELASTFSLRLLKLPLTLLIIFCGIEKTQSCENSFQTTKWPVNKPFNSNKNLTQIQLLTPASSPDLNTMEKWSLNLKVNHSDNDISRIILNLKPADIQITGGMPAHRHNLPTQPAVIEIKKINSQQIELLIAGIKFQMWGDWFIRLSIPLINDYTDINFKLCPETKL